MNVCVCVCARTLLRWVNVIFYPCNVEQSCGVKTEAAAAPLLLSGGACVCVCAHVCPAVQNVTHMPKVHGVNKNCLIMQTAYAYPPSMCVSVYCAFMSVKYLLGH